MLIIVDADVNALVGKEKKMRVKAFLRRRLSPVDLFCWQFLQRFTLFILRVRLSVRPLAR